MCVAHEGANYLKSEGNKIQLTIEKNNIKCTILWGDGFGTT